MPIIDNADLKLTLTIHADEEKDIAILLREVARKINKGSTAGNGGGCIGSYIYELESNHTITILTHPKIKEQPHAQP
jgi:hypothetical protein